MNRPDFSELVAALKGGSSKNARFQPDKLGNFDGARDQKVVDVWLVEMEDYLHAAKVGRHSAVELAQSYLKGYAATCWRTVKQEEGKNHGYTWDFFNERIESKFVPRNLEVQTLRPCECHKWQLAAICEGLFRIHAWDSTHAWTGLRVPICDGASNLGQAEAWGELALLTIQSHHESRRLLRCGSGWKIQVQKGQQILSQETAPWGGMEPRARKPKKGEAQTIPRLHVQTQGRFCEERGSFQSEPTQGRCWVKPKGACFNCNEVEHYSKDYPKSKTGNGALR